jgi:hypothetical protein
VSSFCTQGGENALLHPLAKPQDVETSQGMSWSRQTAAALESLISSVEFFLRLRDRYDPHPARQSQMIQPDFLIGLAEKCFPAVISDAPFGKRLDEISFPESSVR